MKKEAIDKQMSRRDFIGLSAKASLAATAATIVPRHVLGGPGYIAPSDKIALAMIGVGGQGNVDLRGFLPHAEVQVVAVADPNKEQDYKGFYFSSMFPKAGTGPTSAYVDKHYSEQAGNSYKGCKAYADFREMLEKEGDGIDACCVSTTDNVHAVAAMAAIKKGKHVYVQKPMTHDIYEARMLAEAARQFNVVTQMGNQGQAMEYIRLIREWIQGGAIGDVVEVHSWTDRPFWPQGKDTDRPKETPEVPATLDWDLWLGPAPMRSYHGIYVPFNWRGWWDFGTGSLGDMGCHILNIPAFALDLADPVSVQGTTTPMNNETYPLSCMITYDFGPRGEMPPLRLYWYEGGLRPARPKELDEQRKLETNGNLFIGTKGTILCGSNGEGVRLIPESAMEAFKRPPKTLPRTPGIYEDFIRGIRGGPKPCSNFDVSGPLTEFTLMGNLAMKFPGEILRWDAKNLKVTNLEEANQYVKRDYREGWAL
jgi:predicted dehydrogenase